MSRYDVFIIKDGAVTMLATDLDYWHAHAVWDFAKLSKGNTVGRIWLAPHRHYREGERLWH